MEKYLVTFDNQELVLNTNELLNFIQKAVIKNKDISTLSIDRIIDIKYTTASQPTKFHSVNVNSWPSDF